MPETPINVLDIPSQQSHHHQPPPLPRRRTWLLQPVLLRKSSSARSTKWWYSSAGRTSPARPRRCRWAWWADRKVRRQQPPHQPGNGDPKRQGMAQRARDGEHEQSCGNEQRWMLASLVRSRERSACLCSRNLSEGTSGRKFYWTDVLIVTFV